MNAKIYVFVEETEWQGKDIANASPVQRAVIGAKEDIRAWLDMMSVDIFEQQDTFEEDSES